MMMARYAAGHYAEMMMMLRAIRVYARCYDDGYAAADWRVMPIRLP